ncbi:hypothetical protein HK103_004323 [Boothiomyces macroporosus]|uniref:Protein kinase domain-containing protein n=1 Tax=Boothiomyces macroporosus TaxID=261099 RepID=A0AAD5UGR6_9FUNG|nr:hypothetical protein HK103_004323 [Boothiomyces macroporosus]
MVVVHVKLGEIGPMVQSIEPTMVSLFVKKYFPYLNPLCTFLYHKDGDQETFLYPHHMIDSKSPSSTEIPFKVVYIPGTTFLSENRPLKVPESLEETYRNREFKIEDLETKFPASIPPVNLNEGEIELNSNSLVGSSQCLVYRTTYQGKLVALKVISLGYSHRLIFRQLNEVAVYEKLKDLQGKEIPEFYGHGYIGKDKYYIAISICGKARQRLTVDQRASLYKTLEKVHAKRILHESIKLPNVTVDDEGKTFLIDFGRSRWDNDEEAFKYELLDVHRYCKG